MLVEKGCGFLFRRRPAVVVHRPEPVDITVVPVEQGIWEVSDRRIARIVNLNDLTNPDALDYLHERLRKIGVDRALSRARVKHGDSVRIGRLEFNYEED